MIPAAASLLFGAALRALLAACALWLGLRLLRVRNVRAQKAAWSVVLVAALAMPMLVHRQWLPDWAEVRFPAPSWSAIFRQAPSPTIAATPAVSRVDESAIAPDAIAVAPEPVQRPRVRRSHRVDPQPLAARAAAPALPVPDVSPSAAAPAKPVGERISLLATAWLFYFAVAAVLLFRLLIGLCSSLGIWMRARPVKGATIRGFDCGIPVRSSSSLSSPVNIGSGIVLPADYLDWDAEKLRVVLAHEGAHIRQRDFYLQLLAGFYTAFNWFSPLGWWLKHKLSELSEAISDQAGLEEAASRSAYAQLLLEFAAQPRPTFTGVAMAHSSNLSHRIERLLNESSFKQAFGGTRRVLIAALVFPVVLFATAAMIHVVKASPLQQPAGAQPSLAQAAEPNPAPGQVPVTGQSNGTQVTDQASDQTPPPQAAPAPTPAPAPAPDAMPPAPPAGPEVAAPAFPAMPQVPPINVQVQIPPIPPMPPTDFFGNGPQGPCMGNGDAYAIVGDPGTKTRFCGDWGDESAADVEKARGKAQGHFLLFRHEGKLYIVDDPATVSQIENMDKAMHDQGEQMRALGKQMRNAGEVEREAARKAREATRNLPAPDLSKEIAALDAAVAELKASQGATVTREQLAEVERKVRELERSLMSSEMNVKLNTLNSDEMKNFFAEQGKFGEQMGQLGAEMGRIARENHEKMRSIMDESLKNGKARPVD
jgi:beta-lactamase regulating signal transducer with metallopeptidase domain